MLLSVVTDHISQTKQYYILFEHLQFTVLANKVQRSVNTLQILILLHILQEL